MIITFSKPIWHSMEPRKILMFLTLTVKHIKEKGLIDSQTTSACPCYMRYQCLRYWSLTVTDWFKYVTQVQRHWNRGLGMGGQIFNAYIYYVYICEKKVRGAMPLMQVCMILIRLHQYLKKYNAVCRLFFLSILAFRNIVNFHQCYSVYNRLKKFNY